MECEEDFHVSNNYFRFHRKRSDLIYITTAQVFQWTKSFSVHQKFEMNFENSVIEFLSLFFSKLTKHSIENGTIIISRTNNLTMAKFNRSPSISNSKNLLGCFIEVDRAGPLIKFHKLSHKSKYFLQLSYNVI